MLDAVISTIMEVKRALITAAGDDQRTLSLQSLVDRDGNAKTALCILIEEVLSAGIDSIGVVIHPDDKTAFRSAAGQYADRGRTEADRSGAAVGLLSLFLRYARFVTRVAEDSRPAF